MLHEARPLGSPELVIFTTRDIARLAGISLTAASKRLARLSAANASLVQLTRGAWANRAHPYFNVLACVPVLLGSEQGYVSFLSALHLHGAIAPIPANVQVATTGHARSVRTPVGTLFLQLEPAMLIDGVVWSDAPKPTASPRSRRHCSIRSTSPHVRNAASRSCPSSTSRTPGSKNSVIARCWQP